MAACETDPGPVQCRQHEATCAWYRRDHVVDQQCSAELFGRRVPGRYLRVRYEDIIAEPRASVEQILGMVTERRVELPFVGERVVDLQPTHSVEGNPDRLTTGRTELRLDDEWKSRLSRSDHRFVTAMTWPLLVRYGYGARTSTPGDPRNR